MDDLMNVVDWSRWQFALTAMYHWLFVPLTLGLSIIVGLMETIYYKTKDAKWLAITKFWMLLFGINFACGVATGIILEFELKSGKKLKVNLCDDEERKEKQKKRLSFYPLDYYYYYEINTFSVE